MVKIGQKLERKRYGYKGLNYGSFSVYTIWNTQG